jgi:hypothetical protein
LLPEAPDAYLGKVDWQMDNFSLQWKVRYTFEVKKEETSKPKRRGENESEDFTPLFELGQLVGTPGALNVLEDAEQNPIELLIRHVTGDWGELDNEDKKENEFSVEQGFRVLSAYTLDTGVKVWVITEADRSATTFLLPDEY